MNCSNCQKSIEGDSKFCIHCGSKVEPVHSNKAEEIGSVDAYLRGRNQGCQVCEADAPTKQVEFRQNIGAFFRRYERSIKGRLCKRCINEYFWKYTLTTLAVGWLGVISFIVAPIYILMNIFNYLGAIGLKTSY